jgi:SsrA-binding protein
MSEKGGSGEKILANHPQAFHEYFISEKLEAGIVLTGTEIKSARQTAPNIKDAWVDIRAEGSKMEAWLMQSHIAPYSHGNIFNHEPNRKRKLLLNRHEIERLFGATIREGFTVIPLRMYLKKGRAKIELGLGKGKKHHDKRDSLKKKSADKEMDRARKQSLKKSK